MATGGLSVIRGNLWYIGGAKQTAWGTAVTPATWYHKWLDGSSADGQVQSGSEREGDTSPYISLRWKTGQYWQFKIVEYVRPQIAGYALQALLGTGSDTYTAPAQSGTLAGPVAAGDAIFTTTANLGSVGMLDLNVDPGYSNAAYEVVTVDLTTKTGSGTFTYTLAASGKFKNAHLSAAVINTLSSHVLTRQPLTFDPYTYEFGWGAAAGATKGAFRMTDCVCTDLTISGSKGKPLKFEHTWLAATGKYLTSLSSPTYEGTNQVGASGGPFIWYQGNTWNLNGDSATNNAATIEQLSLQLKNGATWDEHQSEALTPGYFQPGNIDITGSLSVEFQSFKQYLDTYFGSPTAANNATDSYLVGFESLLLKWATDAVNTFQINLPRIDYTAANLAPKLDGKSVMQPLSFTASKPTPGGSFTDAAIFTLTNSANAQY